MDLAQLRELFDTEQRRDVEYPGQRREVLPELVRHVGLPEAPRGCVLWSRLSADTADRAIREQKAYYDSLGQLFEWKVYDYDEPRDLLGRLATQGFGIGDPEAVMVLDLDEAPEVLRRPATHDVRRLDGPDAVDQVMAVAHQVWGEPLEALASELRAEQAEYPDRLSMYMAYVDGEPAAACWMRYHPGSQFATLWGGSTLSQYRGRGLYTALLAVRGQDARARGVRFLAVDASAMSQPILARHGFQRLATTWACTWPPEDEAG